MIKFDDIEREIKDNLGLNYPMLDNPLAESPISNPENERIETFIKLVNPRVYRKQWLGNIGYERDKDEIIIPTIENFISSEHYYHTFFHEIAHWTGHKTRLNRLYRIMPSSIKSDTEEVIAETVAYYLSSRLGLSPNLKKRSMRYIQLYYHPRHFPRAMKESRRAIMFLNTLIVPDTIGYH